MSKWVDLMKWGKKCIKDSALFVFFLTPFLTFYAIMQFRIKTPSNVPCVIAATLIFILVLLYGVFKYLQVEYMKQEYLRHLSKQLVRETRKRVRNGRTN